MDSAVPGYDADTQPLSQSSVFISKKYSTVCQHLRPQPVYQRHTVSARFYVIFGFGVFLMSLGLMSCVLFGNMPHKVTVKSLFSNFLCPRPIGRGIKR